MRWNSAITVLVSAGIVLLSLAIGYYFGYEHGFMDGYHYLLTEIQRMVQE